MHRFYLPPEECAASNLVLEGREAHHALKVLRIRRDDEVHVLDGAGHDIRCAVQATTKEAVHLLVLDRTYVPPLPYQITLLQALPKGKLFDAIIQKSTELGAHRIVPLMSERVVAQLDAEDAAAKAARWQLVAIEAIKQCGSPWLPQVKEPITPQVFLKEGSDFELPLFGSLQPNARHPRVWFAEFRAANRRLPRSVSLWVGPEGDFSPAEVTLLESAGVKPITLGRLVLRTETAAAYCLSVTNYELQWSEP